MPLCYTRAFKFRASSSYRPARRADNRLNELTEMSAKVRTRVRSLYQHFNI